MLADKLGRVWIGTKAGVCILDSPKAKIVSLARVIAPDTLCAQNIRCLLLNRTGLLWIGTNKGINTYDIDKRKIKMFDPGEKYFPGVNNEILSMMEDHSGSIWINVANKGIFRYDPSTGTSTIYHHIPTDSSSLSSDSVRSVMEDSHHKIWIATAAGISIYQPGTNNFISYHNDRNNRTALSSKDIADIYEDRSGAIWVTTNNKGIDNYYPTAKKFTFFPFPENKTGPGAPTNLYKDHNGKIYITTKEIGLEEFDPGTNKFTFFKTLFQNEKIPINNFYGAYEDANENLWIMSGDEGLHKFDRKKGTHNLIYTKPGNTSVSMTEAADKRLWVGTNDGLRCYDPARKVYLTAEEIYPATPELKFAVGIVNLYLDHDGILWIAGNGGLVYLNTKTGKARSIVQDTENPNSISSNAINNFYDDGKGTIWIGTTWGLDRFDKRTEKFINYTVKDGLPDNDVLSAILPDDKGNLWLSTKKGICKISFPHSEKNPPVFRNYDRMDGLPDDEFRYAVKGNEGTFYFSCKTGIVAFKPDQLKDNSFVPPVLITDFSIFNKSVAPNDSTGILKVPVDETNEIKLSYKQNAFSFTFTALNFIHSEKNQFAYKLENFDNQWTYTDATKRYANYTNLSAGNYVFKVRASNNDGLWNDEGASIKLVITPPFWQTPWFKMACVLAGTIILYMIWYSRLQKRRDIDRIRNKIAGDLHDDLGATLSSISIMSELVYQQVKDQSPQAIPLLEKIGTSSRNMIESVNDMVWAINPKNDSFENIIRRMRNFGSEILSAKDIALYMDVDKNLLESKLKIETRRNLYLIFKEAVNNIAKYSGAENTFVVIRIHNNKIKMIISDDGCGFDLHSEKKGNGLVNMKKRAETMKAGFNVISVPAKGTTIELEFKNE